MFYTDWKTVLEYAHYEQLLFLIILHEEHHVSLSEKAGFRKPLSELLSAFILSTIWESTAKQICDFTGITPHPWIVPKALHLLSKSATMDLDPQVPVLIFF